MSETRVTHVWVDVTGVFDHNAEAGILLEWRHQRTVHGLQWQGLVISAATHSLGGGLGWQVRQRWIEAAHIRPADPPRKSSDPRRPE